jgi:hypothetical protein
MGSNGAKTLTDHMADDRWLGFDGKKYTFEKTKDHVFGQIKGGLNKRIGDMSQEELIYVIATGYSDRDGLNELLGATLRHVLAMIGWHVRPQSLENLDEAAATSLIHLVLYRVSSEVARYLMDSGLASNMEFALIKQEKGCLPYLLLYLWLVAGKEDVSLDVVKAFAAAEGIEDGSHP